MPKNIDLVSSVHLCGTNVRLKRWFIWQVWLIEVCVCGVCVRVCVWS